MPFSSKVSKMLASTSKKLSSMPPPPNYKTLPPAGHTTKPIPEEDDSEYDEPPPKSAASKPARAAKEVALSKPSRRDDYDDEPRDRRQKSSAKESRRDDSDEESPVREERPRRKKMPAKSSRRDEFDADSDADSDNESPDRRKAERKKKTAAKSSRRNDSRDRDSSDDNDRYGASKRGRGNRARDRSEDRGNSRALVKRGVDKGGKGRKSKRDKAMLKVDEDTITIQRFKPAKFSDLYSQDVDFLCDVMMCEPQKIAVYCKKGFICWDRSTSRMDVQGVLDILPDFEVERFEKAMKIAADRGAAARVLYGRSKYLGKQVKDLDEDNEDDNPFLRGPRGGMGREFDDARPVMAPQREDRVRRRRRSPSSPYFPNGSRSSRSSRRSPSPSYFPDSGHHSGQLVSLREQNCGTWMHPPGWFPDCSRYQTESGWCGAVGLCGPMYRSEDGGWD
ncbi:hypothetical protein MMC12_005183 [Toensbergia leucococca]|nr:hypothetical protein [Toensbergia leucococca]